MKFHSSSSFFWVFIVILIALGIKGLFSHEDDFSNSNIFLISVDSIRPDHLTPYGYKENTTPRLNDLGKDGVIFYYAYAQSTHTASAMATIFTSLLPREHGAFFSERILSSEGKNIRDKILNGEMTIDDLAQKGHSPKKNLFTVSRQEPLHSKHQTIAEKLADSGYQTAGFTSSGFFTEKNGFADGFGFFEGTECGWGSAECINKEVFKWLGKKSRPPFFMWVHYNDLVDDFHLTGIHHDLSPSLKKNLYSEQGLDEKKAALSRYDTKLGYLDSQIGSFLERLKELGLYNNSLIAFIGTTGEELGEHGGWGHGTSVYNEQIHIPLMIKFPGNRFKGAIVDGMVRQADMAPTILDTVTATPIPNTFGVSLIPDIQGIGAETMEIYSESRANGLLQAIIERKYKLIAHQESGKREFYKIKKDFREQNNLIEKSKMDADRLHKRIEERFSPKD